MKCYGRCYNRLQECRKCRYRKFCAEAADVPLLPAGKSGFSVPDFSFRRTDGLTVHLELFHRWHKWSFQPRLEFLNENPDHPLILGVDRGAVNDEEFDSLCREFPLAAARSFRFRDFPGVETVLKMLDKFAENKKEEQSQKKRKKKNEPKK